MGLIADLFLSALVLTAGFLVTTRLIPFVVVRALRALGFKAKASPVTAKRIARFKRIKRGYFSFLAITTLFVTSLFLELLVNGSALAIHYDDHTAFPAVAEWFDKVVPFVTISSYNKKSDFGQIGESGVDYRAFDRHAEDPATLRAELDAERAAIDRDRADLLANAPGPDAKRYQQRRHERNLKKLDKREAELATLEESYKVFERGGAWCIMPLYPYGPTDLRLDLPSAPPHKPFKNGLPLGTDTSGRDVLALMLYGFRISLAFALLVSAAGYSIGIVVGAVQGYYGGWTDIITQRFQEIWGSIPFLFTIMIVASIIQPSFGLLASLMIVLTSWLGIT